MKGDAGGFESGLARFFLCLLPDGVKTGKFLRNNAGMS
jgi:hypothetical protein